MYTYVYVPNTVIPAISNDHIHCVFTDGGEVCIVERLFSSSLVALVELSNPRKLRLCHFKVSYINQFLYHILVCVSSSHVHQWCS